jgi:hypothetical protein
MRLLLTHTGADLPTFPRRHVVSWWWIDRRAARITCWHGMCPGSMVAVVDLPA